MAVDPLTRQQLLELIYDLLADEQAAELRRRIESEPEVAAAYEDARRTAGLLAQAARIEAPKVEYRRAERAAAPAETRGRPNRARVSPWARGANWAVSLAAAVLLAFSLGGYFYHRQELADLAAGHLRLLVTGPARLQSGVANTYTIATSTVTGSPLPCKIELALYSPNGQPLRRQEEQTDSEGRLRLTLPAETSLSGAARLEVVAAYRNNREKLTADLPVVPVRYAAHLQMDRAWYRPGDTVRFRAVVLSRFKLTADRQMPVEFSVQDESGRQLPGWPIEARSRQGVAAAEWAIPADLAAGRCQLIAESRDGLFQTRRAAIVVRAPQAADLAMDLEFSRPAYRAGETVVAYFAARRPDGGPAGPGPLSVSATLDGSPIYRSSGETAAGPVTIRFPLPSSVGQGDARLAVSLGAAQGIQTVARRIPLAPPRLDVRFQPEGGPLVAGLRNRVYFTARDAEGRPAELRGVVVDSRDLEVAELETTHAGMGMVSFTPSAGEQYRARIITPAGVPDERKLPEVTVQTKVVLGGGPGVFPAGQPLEIEVDAVAGGLPLVVAATCRGVPVGQQTLITSDTQQQNRIKLPLASDAAGVIGLAVYEYRSERPSVVAERLVFRRPQRPLEMTIADGEKPYPPGHEVKLSLRSRGEKGEPLPAVLGVAAAPEEQSRLDGLAPLGLPAEFYFDGRLQSTDGLGDPNAWLADDARAAAALDLLLAMQPRRLAPGENPPPANLVAQAEDVEPPAVFDNLGQLRAAYEKSLAAYRAERTKALNTLTTLSFFGGFGLVLLVAMLAVLKIISGIRLWVPASGAAIACLVLGAMLMNPNRFQHGRDAEVAFVPYHGPAELALKTKSNQADEKATVAVGMKRSLLSSAAPPAASPAAPAAVPAAGGLRQQEMEQSVEGGSRRAMREAAADLPLRSAAPIAAPSVAAKASRPMPMLEKGQSLGFGRAGGGQLSGAASAYGQTLKLDDLDRSAKDSAAPPPGTLLWQPALETRPDGDTEVAFRLNKAGNYRVRVDAHADGRLGHAERLIQCRVPFELAPRVPAELSLGDQVELPLTVTNPTEQPLSLQVVLERGGEIKLLGGGAAKIDLGPGESRRERFRLEATAAGPSAIGFRGLAGRYSDLVTRTIDVLPAGYPARRATSGRLRGERSLSVELPEFTPGSLAVSLAAMPTLLAELERAHAAIEQPPGSCAEQAAASAWLSALALQWMERNGALPEVARRWRERLAAALDQLARYESPPRGFGGYEWFAGHPGNDEVSAFALAALEAVHRAGGRDPGRDHLAAWLLGRRDAQGVFQVDPKSLGPVAPPELLRAEMTWALARHDPKSIETQLKQVAAAASKADSAYQVSLAAGALLWAGAKDQAAALLDRLAGFQRDDGRVEGKQSSLVVEGTALAAVAWLRAGRGLPADRAIDWLRSARQADGGFGSPQATALALSAAAEQAKARPPQPGSGKIAVRRDDQLLAEREFEAADSGPIVLAGLERGFRPGKNRVSLSMTAVADVAYTLQVAYSTPKPPAAAAPLALATRLGSRLVQLEKPVGLAVEISNTTDRPVPLPVAVIGLPAGLEPRTEQLGQLKKSGAIGHFSVAGRQLTLFWRTLPARQKTAVQVELVGSLAGKFTGPPSAAYLYHSPDAKSWAEPLTVEVKGE